MPVSKNKRKDGRRKSSARVRIIRKACRDVMANRFVDRADFERKMKLFQEEKRHLSRGTANLAMMLNLNEGDYLTESFIKARYALARWNETTDYADFNDVSQALMIGAKCHKAIRVEESSFLEEIQAAAFQSIVCIRLRLRQERIPDANIQVVRLGLDSADQIVEFTAEKYRETLLRVFRENTVEYVNEHPEENEQNHRFILGRHYEQVLEWERADVKNGALPPLPKPKE